MPDLPTLLTLDVAATVDVSALVLPSALLFSVLKFVGAAYLIFLFPGVRTLLSKDEVADVALLPT